jgi:hypothetical protein
MSGTPTSASAYSSEGVPSAAPTDVSRTDTVPAPGDVIPASQQPRAKAGRLSGVDKEASDAINVIILQVILPENRMVRCFLGHKAGSKYFKKDTMTSLMNGLAKHNHPVVKGLSESVLNKRIKVAVDVAKEMSISSDHEKLAKLKDNGNENNVDTGDNLDAYLKCILELAIKEEKLTSAKKEDEERKKASQQDQSARLQAVSKVCKQILTWANRF